MTALLLAATAVLIALNAFFVAAEYALVRARRSRLEALREDGVKNVGLVLDQIEDIGDYISASQVGVTLMSIAIGAVGEPVLAGAFEDVLGDVPSHGLAVVIAVVVAYLLITSAHIVAGELVPKFYVIQHAEGVARRVARDSAALRLPPMLLFTIRETMRDTSRLSISQRRATSTFCLSATRSPTGSTGRFVAGKPPAGKYGKRILRP